MDVVVVNIKDAREDLDIRDVLVKENRKYCCFIHLLVRV
jgi:hypothetical protein